MNPFSFRTKNGKLRLWLTTIRIRSDKSTDETTCFFGDWLMAKKEKRAELFSKLGLIGVILAVIGVLAGMVIILPRWNSQQNIIVIVNPTKQMMIQLTLLISVLCGFLGFLGCLEGAAYMDGRRRAISWAGFWVGTITTMAGIILGLCFWGYKM